MQPDSRVNLRGTSGSEKRSCPPQLFAAVDLGSTLDGFFEGEQLVLATLILGHRRRLPPDTFDALPDRRVVPARRRTVLLRVAVLLHWTRLREHLPQTSWQTDGESLNLLFPKGWLEQHPLTRADLEAERKRLRKIGFALHCR
jgi:exopolyphosphatase/guanosine-5'-triphosphate,3'-diphosphate pyrophosphatase